MNDNKKFKSNMKAVALRYNSGDDAPKVVAKGTGFTADRIVDKAQSSDLPVYKDEKLVNELIKIEIGDSIPPELYEVVAQVLIFISDLDKLEEYRKKEL